MKKRMKELRRLCELAENPATPPEVLALLAEDEDWRVRIRVAKNPATPPEVLVLLAEDPVLEVRIEVGRNTHTPIESLKKLAEDPERGVRFWVAVNPSCPEDLRAEIAGRADMEDLAKWIRKGVPISYWVEVELPPPTWTEAVREWKAWWRENLG